MKRFIVILSILLLTGCGSLRNTAHQAIAADATTTSIGVLSGAATEANPLVNNWQTGVGFVVLRFGAVEYINTLDEPRRTNSLASLNAVTWGVVTNNILAIAGASHPISIVVGGVAGWLVWDATSEEREFMQSCSEYIAKGWTKKCEYKPTTYNFMNGKENELSNN